MSRIFLSHSSSNNATALALASWLHTQGWDDHFLDISESRGIAPGERWMAALAGAVDRCEAVIFLISPAWRDSKFCFAEFFQAKNLGKRIFGVIVEPIGLSQLPDQMTAEWQVCDLTRGEDTTAFTVEREPLVSRTVVQLPVVGLEALARGLRKAGLDSSNFVWPPKADPGRSPYPGLCAFDEPDAAVFFGREASIVRAVDQIRLTRERGVDRLFVILGASGSGKSSFLRAGLLPRLRRDSEHFVVLPPIRPARAAISGSQGLLASLKTALAAAGQASNHAQLRSELADTGLVGVLRRIEAGPQAPTVAPGVTGRTVLVSVDQAEELFASDSGDEAQQLLQHVDGLRQQLMVSEPSPEGARLRVLFVVTIRSDSLPRLQTHAALQRLSPVLFSLPAMPASEFKAVIEGPARRHTETVKPLHISPQLTEELVADAKGADALPLLALTLDWLYREFTTPQGTRMGHDEYTRLGGVRRGIDMAVERAFEQPGLEPAIPAQRAEQERLLEQVFPHIATVDPDNGQWKRRVALRGHMRGAAPRADALVQRLIEQRLLLVDSRQMNEVAEPVEVVEVAHEALLRQWDALERWLRALSADLAASESIRRSAMDWQRGQRDEALLVHTAHRLDAAEALLADDRLKGRFEPLDAQYLGACRERDRSAVQRREDQLRRMAEQQANLAEQQSKRAGLQRQVSWGLSVAAIVVLALMSWIVLQIRDVSRQTSLVFAISAEAAMSRSEFDRGVRLAMLAAHATWLRPADATAEPALSTAADSNALRILLAGHILPVSSASFSPDGRRVVTASWDKTARIWDAKTGKPIGALLTHDDRVSSASFSPDGKRVVTASWDKTARIHEAETGKPIGSLLMHDDPVSSASFSPDGRRVVTASWDKTARIWDAETSKPVGAPLTHNESVSSASFSPDGKRVVTASTDKTARIWDAETGKPVGAPLTHDESVSSAIFSPDGKRVVTASQDKTARIWDAETGKPVGTPLTHDDGVSSAIFSPDGKRVVTASQDKTARIWDAETGKPVGTLLTHDDRVWAASFSPDGKRVVTASWDKTARIWDAETGKPVGTLLTHDDRVWAASFSPDGKRVVTASQDKASRVWDAEPGKPVGAPMTHDDGVSSAAFSPDGSRVVTASQDGSARIWDAETGKPIGAPLTHDDQVSSAAFSPDGKRVLTASQDKTVRFWDAETGKPIGAPLTHDDQVSSAAFSPDGRRVVTASWDKTVRFWDAETGKPIGAPLTHDDGVSSASFSLDGRRVVTASWDKTARIWDAEAGKPVGAPLTHEDPVSSANFSPDGRRVVTASMGKIARIWDAETGKPVGAPLTHDNVVWTASFSPDGKRVLTASQDKTARIWDAETGKPVGVPLTHDESVSSASFSPDGKRVVTASQDKTAQVWRSDWSMFRSTEALIAANCARMNAAARRITLQDRRVAPQISPDLIGRDVCEGAGTIPAQQALD